MSGLVITSTTLGEIADGGGNKVVEMGLQVPPWYLVKGVRVCYELTSQLSYISQIRIAQLQLPPSSALVLLDDGTNLTDMGPVCIDSAAPDGGCIDPAKGGLRLDLRVNFGDLADKIVIRGVGLHLIPDPLSPQQLTIKKLIDEVESLEHALKYHTHKYLTGKGVGHNNVTAFTSPPFEVTPVVVPTAPVVVTTPSTKKK